MPLIGQEEQPQEQPLLPAFLSFTSFSVRNATRAKTAAKTIIVPRLSERKFIKSISTSENYISEGLFFASTLA